MIFGILLDNMQYYIWLQRKQQKKKKLEITKFQHKISFILSFTTIGTNV